jgi:hypothetical protein
MDLSCFSFVVLRHNYQLGDTYVALYREACRINFLVIGCVLVFISLAGGKTAVLKGKRDRGWQAGLPGGVVLPDCFSRSYATRAGLSIRPGFGAGVSSIPIYWSALPAGISAGLSGRAVPNQRWLPSAGIGAILTAFME